MYDSIVKVPKQLKTAYTMKHYDKVFRMGMGEFSCGFREHVLEVAFLSGWAVLPQVIVEAIYLLDVFEL